MSFVVLDIQFQYISPFLIRIKINLSVLAVLLSLSLLTFTCLSSCTAQYLPTQIESNVEQESCYLTICWPHQELFDFHSQCHNSDSKLLQNINSGQPTQIESNVEQESCNLSRLRQELFMLCCARQPFLICHF